MLGAPAGDSGDQRPPELGQLASVSGGEPGAEASGDRVVSLLTVRIAAMAEMVFQLNPARFEQIS